MIWGDSVNIEDKQIIYTPEKPRTLRNSFAVSGPCLTFIKKSTIITMMMMMLMDG
jgi:hypothetical protein